MKGKFRKLVRLMRPMLGNLPVDIETVVVGILERLWHATIRDAQRGDIGRLDDELIAEAVGWHGDANMLVDALVECRWLDRCVTHRLVIHNWGDHAPDFVKGALKRHGKDFAIATCPGQPALEDPAIAASLGNHQPNLTKPNITKPNETERKEPPLPPLPPELDTPRFRDTMADWIANSKTKYKARGLQAMATRAAKRAETHGVDFVCDAMERAMANGWQGWDNDDLFPTDKALPSSRVPTAEDDATWAERSGLG